MRKAVSFFLFFTIFVLLTVEEAIATDSLSEIYWITESFEKLPQREQRKMIAELRDIISSFDGRAELFSSNWFLKESSCEAFPILACSDSGLSEPRASSRFFNSSIEGGCIKMKSEFTGYSFCT